MYVLVNFVLNQNKEEVDDQDFNSLIKIELSLIPNEIDNLKTNFALTNGVAVYNTLPANHTIIYQLTKINPDDNLFILEMSPCKNDIEYKMLKKKNVDEKETSDQDYIDIIPKIENGRYITYFSPISNTNYLEVKNPLISKSKIKCDAYNNTNSTNNCKNYFSDSKDGYTLYWIKYFSVKSERYSTNRISNGGMICYR